ncbi:insulin-degrading enzyme [Fomitiporia mediterranea MF3/22]|uniref:insulin-degrading enzyme n=1 Tax=Fomitiporia mediterranea (strain MF3/22) TaxID=694068 RepID=UPI0004408553|nr:insulin-degrading enzyme [Fomitiporia mediterranea MF3/22]EJD07222.1 insulin-degrading enzyme [Fomitiporia mediterranea MF3/22]
MEDANNIVNIDTPIEEDAANWKQVPAKDGYPAYHVYTVPIEKSPADDREYRIIRLENKLEAILVHDEKTDKAAASLNVATGNFYDPDDIPGLAHLCEHMLFLGSDEFPKENEFDEYLSKRDGATNGWTTGSEQGFYFAVASDSFEGALHRFSAVLHGPRFDPDSTMREINAVDSEFIDTIQDDGSRISEVEGSLARRGHPFGKFDFGNKETLTQAGWATKNRSKSTLTKADRRDKTREGQVSTSNDSTVSKENDDTKGALETRRRLIEWWKKEYCAGRMKLALVGKESLDDLARFVTKYFSPVKNRGLDPLPKVPDDPYGKNELSKFVHVKTVMDLYEVDLTFPIPWQTPHWRVTPADYLAHLIGHEGPGSILAYLKSKGLVNELCASCSAPGRGVSQFEVSIDLTKEGFKKYREVILVIFNYINLLRDSEIPKYVYEEFRTLGELSFRYAEKINACPYSQILSGMLELQAPRALLLSALAYPRKWDKKLVRETLNALDVKNCYIFVAAQDHSQIGKTGPWLTERWYGTQYMEEKFHNDFISAARKKNDIKELALPKPNEFIPKNTDVEKIDVSEPKKRPSLIKRNSLLEVWHKKDDQFWVPRAHVFLFARTPIAGTTARAHLMTILFADLVEDHLSDYSYDAQLAGLSYEFDGSIQGIGIGIGGYSDKLHVLLRRVLETIKGLKIKKDRLAVMMENVQMDLENILLEDSSVLAKHHLIYLLRDRQYTIEEELEALKEITAEDLAEHAKKVLAELKFKVLVNGNLRKEDALSIESMVEDILGPKPVPSGKLIEKQSRLLPKGTNYIWELPVPNPGHISSCVAYYCHIGNVSDSRIRVIANLIGQIMQQPTYDTLRTKEQLGYYVGAQSVEGIESIGWALIIQSEKDPRYLELRIESFLHKMRKTIEEMEESDFEEHKKSLVHMWTEKLHNLSEESDEFWSAITSGYYDFQGDQKDAQLVQNVTKSDVLTMYKKFIDPASDKRSKLSVHLRSQNPPGPKFSEEAAKSFLQVLRKAGIKVNEEEYNAECQDEPPVAQIRAYWEEGLREETEDNDKKVEKLLAEFDKLVEKYPAKGQQPVELDAKVEFIKDGKKFREGLELSGPAKPVENFEVE